MEGISETSQAYQVKDFLSNNTEFNLDSVIEKAMDCFYSNGYHATSVQLLTSEINISEDELIEIFGDKHTLFEAVLANYSQVIVDMMVGRLECSDEPLTEIKDLIKDVVRVTIEDEERRGCLVTNAAVEFGSKDEKIMEAVNRTFSAIEDVFCRSIQRAQSNGDLEASKDPRSLARFLVSTIQGIRVMGRTTTDATVLNSIYESAIKCLD